jgi:hypothetical protein
MYADACGEVVDSVDGSWVATTNLGASFGTQHLINGSKQTTYINPENYDVLVTYQNGSATLLDVYQNEVTGCGPHLNLTASDGHDYARYGQTLNYLVVLSASGATAENIGVSLSTPGTGLDLASATWTCVGSDISAICPSSSGTGAALGSVTLPPGTSMNWIVSVPVSTGTTDDTIELDANAAGPASASGSDTDALVIFRSGFDVANSDGTRGKD